MKEKEINDVVGFVEPPVPILFPFFFLKIYFYSVSKHLTSFFF